MKFKLRITFPTNSPAPTLNGETAWESSKTKSKYRRCTYSQQRSSVVNRLTGRTQPLQQSLLRPANFSHCILPPTRRERQMLLQVLPWYLSIAAATLAFALYQILQAL